MSLVIDNYVFIQKCAERIYASARPCTTQSNHRNVCALWRDAPMFDYYMARLSPRCKFADVRANFFVLITSIRGQIYEISLEQPKNSVLFYKKRYGTQGLELVRLDRPRGLTKSEIRISEQRTK